RDIAGTVDAWNGVDLVERARDETYPFVARARHVELEAEHAIAVETAIHLIEPPQAVRQHAGRREQPDRERDLRHRQQLLRPWKRARRYAAPRPRSPDVGEQRGPDADNEHGGHADQKAEPEHARIERDALNDRQPQRRQRPEGADADG